MSVIFSLLGIGVWAGSQWCASALFVYFPFGARYEYVCNTCGRVTMSGGLLYSRFHILRFSVEHVEKEGDPTCPHENMLKVQQFAEGFIPREYWLFLVSGYLMWALLLGVPLYVFANYRRGRH